MKPEPIAHTQYLCIYIDTEKKKNAQYKPECQDEWTRKWGERYAAWQIHCVFANLSLEIQIKLNGNKSSCTNNNNNNNNINTQRW